LNNNLKLSIITPNYNYARFIGKLITSVVEQDYDNIEHIIVDDGSTDDSVDIINSFIKKYPRKIKLITQPNHILTITIMTKFFQKLLILF